MSSIRFSGLASGMDTENMVRELMKVEEMKVTKVEKEKTKSEWTQEIWKEMNTDLYGFYTKEVASLKSSGTFQTKEATVSDSGAMTVTAGTSAVKGTHALEVSQLASGAFLTSGTVISSVGATDSLSIEGVDIGIADGDSIDTVISKINDKTSDTGVVASYDSEYERMFLSTTETGTSVATVGTASEIDVAGSGDIATALSGGTSVPAKNATFKYNGVDLTSSDNDISINGLEINLKSKTTGAVTINVTQDTDAIYDKVKDFMLKYNELVLNINEKINADYNKDYEPLTDDEKEAMSDDDIKLWEDKVKSSLLRRDSTLDSIQRSMRDILISSSGVVGTDSMQYKYLSDLGIVTGEYTERGILHIKGDEDDPIYADEDNKLREAIESDPEKVANFLNALGTELSTTLFDKMKSTTLSSALTFYNNKQIDNTIDDYEERIADLQERMTAIENRYYAQFSAMEQAIQQMNNQSSSLMSMMGGGQ